MIVFNLGCSKSHIFEGWFASSADYATQQESGLLSCPVCGDQQVQKRLSAPRLNLATSKQASANPALASQSSEQGGSLAEAPSSAATPTLPRPVGQPTIEQMQALWYQVAAQITRNTEDVGNQFAEQARKMHYNEAPGRAIRGQASEDQRRELQEEGIEVFALPMPVSMKETLQ